MTEIEKIQHQLCALTVKKNKCLMEQAEQLAELERKRERLTLALHKAQTGLDGSIYELWKARDPIGKTYIFNDNKICRAKSFRMFRILDFRTALSTKLSDCEDTRLTTYVADLDDSLLKTFLSIEPADEEYIFEVQKCWLEYLLES